jgi:DNA-binding NarL/FixJ family response regulator
MAGRIKTLIGAELTIPIADASFPLHIRAVHHAQPQAEADLLKLLSKRELEVLIGLVHGESNSAISSRLQLSKKSVSTYRSRVLEKLKVENNAQLVSFAARSGILQSDVTPL